MAEKKRHLGINRIKTFVSVILLAAALGLSIAARTVQGFAQWYSIHLYPLWVGSIGRFMGYFPFSISEMLLYVLLLAAVLSVMKFAAAFVRGRAEQNETSNEQSGLPVYDKGRSSPVCRQLGAWLRNITLLAVILLFLYVVNCGINYQRESFEHASGIITEEYSAQQLEEVCLWLTEKVSAYSGKVKREADGGMALDLSPEENAVAAMQRLGETYPELKGCYPRPKKLVNSWILSIQGLSGVYSPFTIEANFNGDMQDFYIPFTACHELSHLRGFMQEQEANFIAFLACTESSEEAFAYSGYLSGWIQCMNVLYRIDYDTWEEIRAQFPAEAEADLKLNREFWAKYDGRIAEVSNKVNDTYLKANGQQDGVKSYNRMVDLIVAYYGQDIVP